MLGIVILVVPENLIKIGQSLRGNTNYGVTKEHLFKMVSGLKKKIY
jgi:hypothetical protein